MGGQTSQLGCPGPDCFPSKESPVVAVANNQTIVGAGEYRRISPTVRDMESKRAKQPLAPPQPVDARDQSSPYIIRNATDDARDQSSPYFRKAARPVEESNVVPEANTTPDRSPKSMEMPSPSSESKSKLRNIFQHPYSLVSTMRHSNLVQAQEFIWTLRSDLQGMKATEALFADKHLSAAKSRCTDACREVEKRGTKLLALDDIVSIFQDALDGKNIRQETTSLPNRNIPVSTDSPRTWEGKVVEQAKAASVHVLPNGSPPSHATRESWGMVERKGESASVVC